MKLTSNKLIEILRKRVEAISDRAEHEYEFAIAREFYNLADAIEDEARAESRLALEQNEKEGK